MLQHDVRRVDRDLPVAREARADPTAPGFEDRCPRTWRAFQCWVRRVDTPVGPGAVSRVGWSVAPARTPAAPGEAMAYFASAEPVARACQIRSGSNRQATGSLGPGNSLSRIHRSGSSSIARAMHVLHPKYGSRPPPVTA